MSTRSITPVQGQILHNAATQENGLIEFLKLTQKGHARTLVIKSMTVKGFIKEANADGQYQMTENGYKAIGIEPPKTEIPKKVSKQTLILEMLSRPEGATNTQMMIATNWLPHSVRGFVSAVVRKKLGLNVTSAKNKSGERVYRVAHVN